MRIRFKIALIYVIILTFASCGEKNYINEGAVWGTSYRICYSSPAGDLSDSVTSVMRSVELELSMFDSLSTVSRFNRGETVAVSSMLAEVLDVSRDVWRRSAGAFDPTVAPAVELWGFGRRRLPEGWVPDSASVDSVRALVGLETVLLTDNGRLKAAGNCAGLDFSAIAKGLGVDCVAAMLRRNGCNDYIVEIGGEIAVSGLSPRRRPWRVQIDSPASGFDGHEALRLIEAHNCAIATSGNYRNYRETGRGRVGHTIDPRTCFPAVTPTLSATVIAPTCIVADALATACMVLTPDEALEVIASYPGAELLMVVMADNETDSMSVVSTPGFPSFGLR